MRHLLSIFLLLTMAVKMTALEEGLDEATRQKAERHYQQGVTYKQNKAYARAIDELRQTLQLNPEHVGAHWVLAWVYVAQEEKAAAAGHFREVVRLAPDTDQGQEAKAALERLGLPLTPEAKETETRLPSPAQGETSFTLVHPSPVADFWLVRKATDKDLRVHFLNVPPGDVVLIQTPDLRDILINGGTAEAGPRVSQYLNEMGVRILDKVIVTRGGDVEKNVLGLMEAIRKRTVSTLLDNGQELPSRIRSRFSHHQVAQPGPLIETPDYRIELLTPPTGPEAPVGNNPLLLSVTAGSFSCLLPFKPDTVSKDWLLKQPNLKAKFLYLVSGGEPEPVDPALLEHLGTEVVVLSERPTAAMIQALDGYPGQVRYLEGEMISNLVVVKGTAWQVHQVHFPPVLLSNLAPRLSFRLPQRPTPTEIRIYNEGLAAQMQYYENLVLPQRLLTDQEWEAIDRGAIEAIELALWKEARKYNLTPQQAIEAYYKVSEYALKCLGGWAGFLSPERVENPGVGNTYSDLVEAYGHGTIVPPTDGRTMYVYYDRLNKTFAVNKKTGLITQVINGLPERRRKR
jgi:beta-lactamase superfamily II metal-dependent hydrolase